MVTPELESHLHIARSTYGSSATFLHILNIDHASSPSSIISHFTSQVKKVMVRDYKCQECNKVFEFPQSLRKHNFKYHEDKVHQARQHLASKRTQNCEHCGNGFMSKDSLRNHKRKCLIGMRYSQILAIEQQNPIENQVLSKDNTLDSQTLGAPASDDEQQDYLEIHPLEEFKLGGLPPKILKSMSPHQDRHKQSKPQVEKTFRTTTKDTSIDLMNASTDISLNPSKETKCLIYTQNQVVDLSKQNSNYPRAMHLGQSQRTCSIRLTPKKRSYGSIQHVSDVVLQIAKFIDDNPAHSNVGGPAKSDMLSSISRVSEDHMNQSNSTITDIAALVVKDQSNLEPPQVCDVQLRINKFRTSMYNFISSKTNLDWSYQEIIPRESQPTPVHMTRSKGKVAPDDQLDGTDSQICYGEATQGCIQQLIKILQDIGISSTSTFVDIGSGYGKVVIDIAISTPMLSYGIECSIKRARLSNECLAELQSSNANDKDILECLNRVQFQHLNLCNLKSLSAPDGAPITHLYSFNVRFSFKDNITLAKLINKTKHLQVFAWCKDERTTLGPLEVKNYKLHSRFSMTMQGSGERHMLYIYKSTRLGEINKMINANDDLPQSSLNITNKVGNQPEVDPPRARASSCHEQIQQNLSNQVSLDEDMQNIQEFQLNDQEKANYLILRQNIGAGTAREILQKKHVLQMKKQQTLETIHLESALNKVQRFNKFFGIVRVALAHKNKVKIEDIYRQDATIRKDLLEEVPLAKFIEEIQSLSQLAPGWFEVKIMNDGSKWIAAQNKQKANDVRQAIARILDQAPSTTRGVEVHSTQSIHVPQPKDEQVNIANILNQLELHYQINHEVADKWTKVSNLLEGVVLVEESESEVELTQSDQKHVDQLMKIYKYDKKQEEHVATINQSYLKLKREMKLVEKQKRKNQQMAKTLAQMQNNYYIHQSQTAILANQHHLDMMNKLYGERFNLKVERTLPSDFFSMRYLCTRVNQGQPLNSHQSIECILKVSHRPSDSLYNAYTQAQNIKGSIQRQRLWNAVLPEASEFEDRIYEVYPYRGTDLASFAERIKRNVDQQSKAILNLICLMKDLHHKKLNHGSLSDRCISFSGDCEVYIDSWGYPLNVQHHDSVFQLIKNFAAPEQFYSNSNTQEVDCFSVGVICYYIIHRKLPYSKEEMQLWNTGKPCGSNRIAECDEPMCKQTIGFLRKLLKRDPKNRWQLHQVVQDQQYQALLEQNQNQIRSLQQ
ncbi:snf1p [Stylonychia lemnae]|uniref:Histone-lysine N-methyltransferase, H3 lysine-79 specific n=1 Tax=Stylonychia lemnae TaxID=5949 RepID=A0A077ZW51_STYLE|nr:snf1p [Stylonychia lemnae]|eukprot:CDW74180.1 snf1p [Stylonychia lemnae]